MTSNASKTAPVFRFFTLLAVSLLVAFFVHVFVLKKLALPQYENYIVLSYLINYILTGIIVSTLFFLKKKYLEQFGYLFLFGSFLKFIIFFIFFYPKFNELDGFSRIEFFAFFIPYAVCLIVETISLIKIIDPRKKQE